MFLYGCCVGSLHFYILNNLSSSNIHLPTSHRLYATVLLVPTHFLCPAMEPIRIGLGMSTESSSHYTIADPSSTLCENLLDIQDLSSKEPKHTKLQAMTCIVRICTGRFEALKVNVEIVMY